MSKLLRQIKKRRKEMTNHNGKPTVIPMRVPNVGQPQRPGAGPQQIQFDIKDTAGQPCVKCSGWYFDLSYRLQVLSRLNPKNPTGQDALIKMEVYLCRSCGHEYGQPVVMSDGKAD